MRLFSFLAAFFLASAPLAAQTVTPQGTDATFDVATWNIENFGTGAGGAAQRDIVAEVIRQSDVDLWALQEIVDTNDFNALLQTIVDDGYRGVLGADPGGGGQKLAYIYNENVVTVNATTTILAGNEFNFAGRLPFVMLGRATVGGQTQSFRAVNIHAKCCGDSRSYERRTEAAIALKAYTDDQIERGRTILLLGDFNDRLNISTAGGLSPYRPYRSDPDYTIATFDIDRVNTPTFCGNSSCSSGSTLDHILFSNDLGASYVPDADPRFEQLLDEISSYTSTTSDHLPVIAQFTLVPVAGEDAPQRIASLTVSPNPVRDAARVSFGLAEPAHVRVDVMDVLGRHVAGTTGAFGSGDQSVSLPTASLAPGVYVVRLWADGDVRTRTIVRAR